MEGRASVGEAHRSSEAFQVLETHSSCSKGGEWCIRGHEVFRSSSSFQPVSRLAELFLPSGYPESVRPGYARYQLWDLVQGLSSYLRGALVMKEILRGFGVGDAHASAAAGAVGWIIRDGAGMAGSLIFAWAAATDFDRNARQWRLFADLVNDLGLTLNMLAPLFGHHGFMIATVFGSTLTSMCGVAAGATKASISQWFAISGNLADCVAKEGTQETAVNILGLIGGLVLCFNSERKLIMWFIFIALTALHIFANICAVSTLHFDSINDTRFHALFERFFLFGKQDMSVDAIADEEPWLPQRNAHPNICMGYSMSNLVDFSSDGLADAIRIARGCSAQYAVVPASRGRGCGVHVLLHPDITAEGLLKARFHAACIETSRTMDEQQWCAFRGILDGNGWNVEKCLLSSRLWRYDWMSPERAKKD
jgi:Vitamin B6 photo-protection and homoeostasis